MMDADEIDLGFLRDCLRQAGLLALGQRGQMRADVKPDHTPVTEADHQVEDWLIQRIMMRYPTHSILSEESGLRAGQDITRGYTWVIDPIDGTRSFASGLPIWGTTIGVLRDGLPLAGGLYLPVTRELYWGTCPPAQPQAWHDDQFLVPIKAVNLESVLVFLAVPSNFHIHFTTTYPRARSMGSTAAHLAYLATGAAVGVLMRGISLWDMAGMLPMLAAVGAQVTTLAGAPLNTRDLLDGQPIREPLLAAHPSVLPQLRALITER